MTEIDEYLIRYGSDFYGEIVVAAQGARVRDRSGREILDFTSGQMCATVGHSHPAVVAAIAPKYRPSFAATTGSSRSFLSWKRSN